MKIETVRQIHLEEVRTLCAQLGYEVEAELLEKRFEWLAKDPDHYFCAATDETGRVVGWGHGFIEKTLITGKRLVIAAMVVDEGFRSKGVGALILGAIERWGQDQHCEAIRVLSRMTRERAHAFYERNGYSKDKVSQVFKKPYLKRSAEGAREFTRRVFQP